MKVGSLVFATDQGLGYLAKDFFDHGVVTDPVVVVHGKRQDHFEWYPNAPILHSLKEWADAVSWIIDDVDVMLFFETPFVWELIHSCRSRGIKTILMSMHECMPRELPAMPDLLACPSALDYQLYQRKGFKNIARINVPVPDWVTWRKRDRAEVFVHNAGNGGLKGRNGTKEFLVARRLVASSGLCSRCICYSQVPLAIEEGIAWITDRKPEHRYDGDVFVFPEKFNGLSLPLQEAFASGMLVMATDRFPNNRWLPVAPLIPCFEQVEDCISARLEPFDSAVVTPQAIAACIDFWHGKDISHYSELGRQFREDMSWAKQKPKWDQLIEDVVKGRLL